MAVYPHFSLTESPRGLGTNIISGRPCWQALSSDSTSDEECEVIGISISFAMALMKLFALLLMVSEERMA